MRHCVSRHSYPFLRSLVLGSLLCVTSVPAMAGALNVVETNPANNAVVPRSTSILVRFDQPVDPASIDHESFRVFGKGSGSVDGTFQFTDGNRRVTFIPAILFSAGELVLVNLSHDIRGADASPLRAAGFAFGFTIRASPSLRSFTEIDVMSNRDGSQTRLYGASSTDLNEDGYLDLATINEVSADVRVFLNRADGSGLFHDFLEPQPIGIEASPNEPADFDNDGHADLCVVAAVSQSVWVMLGDGDGTFGSTQAITVGGNPHGVAVLDVDGDGDSDIVNANQGSSNLSRLLNDGSGHFGSPSYFDSGVNGEYGLATADTNADGIMDLVVAARDGQQIRTLLGQGNGTFTAAGPAQSSGGFTWVVVLGDVNGDRVTDASTANSGSNNGAILLGLGNGNFAPPMLMPTGLHTPSTDLADLDGDGDLDWVLSCYGGGVWFMYTNDGAGNFTYDQQFDAPANPSCAVPLDFDNDGDVDLALTDEIADVIVLMRNDQAASAIETTSNPVPSVHPNPMVDQGRVRFYLPLAGEVRVEFFDPAGRRALVRSLGSHPAGWTEADFDRSILTSLPAGLYLYRLTAEDWRSEGRITVAR